MEIHSEGSESLIFIRAGERVFSWQRLQDIMDGVHPPICHHMPLHTRQGHPTVLHQPMATHQDIRIHLQRILHVMPLQSKENLPGQLPMFPPHRVEIMQKRSQLHIKLLSSKQYAWAQQVQR